MSLVKYIFQRDLLLRRKGEGEGEGEGEEEREGQGGDVCFRPNCTF